MTDFLNISPEPPELPESKQRFAFRMSKDTFEHLWRVGTVLFLVYLGSKSWIGKVSQKDLIKAEVRWASKAKELESTIKKLRRENKKLVLFQATGKVRLKNLENRIDRLENTHDK